MGLVHVRDQHDPHRVDPGQDPVRPRHDYTDIGSHVSAHSSRVAQSSKAMSYAPKKMPYASAVEAIIESALVTWIGLLFYEVTALAPEGHYTVNLSCCHVYRKKY